MTPFVWNGKLMRMEWINPANAEKPGTERATVIRDCESGKFISCICTDILFPSAYIEDDKAYVLGVNPENRGQVIIFESTDLVEWSRRILLTNPGWVYYNTGLTKGPHGYVLLMESSDPVEHIGPYKFTHFFATSPDLYEWSFMDYDPGYSKDRYMGGPWLKYSEGYYYMMACAELTCQRYTNYFYRTKDFHTWEISYYNPILMPSEEDRRVSPNAHPDLTPMVVEKIKTGFLSSSSDIDMCDWNGKTYINYLLGNQSGFCYMAEAVYNGTVAEFLKSLFEKGLLL